MSIFGNALRAARISKRMTQEQVAEALGVTRVAIGQWEKGVTQPSTQNLVNVCSLLGLNLAAATGGMVQIEAVPSLKDPEETFNVLRDRRPEFRDPSEEYGKNWARERISPEIIIDVPIYATAYCQSVGDFIRTDEIVDFAKRPSTFLQPKKHSIYAIYVSSPVLAPRYEEGELIYVSPTRVVTPGSYALIELAGHERDDQRWLMRKIVERTQDHIAGETFQPAARDEISMKDVLRVDRIVPWSELI